MVFAKTRQHEQVLGGRTWAAQRACEQGASLAILVVGPRRRSTSGSRSGSGGQQQDYRGGHARRQRTGAPRHDAAYAAARRAVSRAQISPHLSGIGTHPHGMSRRTESGGSARVLQNLAITQCDALCKLAGIRPVVDGPLALNGTVHASAACAWARRPGRRQGSRHPAWRARLPGRGLLPAPTGTCRGPLSDHVRRSAGLEFGSDPASRGYLGPIN